MSGNRSITETVTETVTETDPSKSIDFQSTNKYLTHKGTKPTSIRQAKEEKEAPIGIQGDNNGTQGDTSASKATTTASNGTQSIGIQGENNTQNNNQSIGIQGYNHGTQNFGTQNDGTQNIQRDHSKQANN